MQAKRKQLWKLGEGLHRVLGRINQMNQVRPRPGAGQEFNDKKGSGAAKTGKGAAAKAETVHKKSGDSEVSDSMSTSALEMYLEQGKALIAHAMDQEGGPDEKAESFDTLPTTRCSQRRPKRTPCAPVVA